MDKKFILVNTTTRAFTIGGRPVDRAKAVYGDNVLFAVEFDENIPGAVASDLVLTGATDLRCVIRDARSPDVELWASQTTYNNGDYATGEDLATGKVTWLVSLTTTAYAITAANTGTNKFTISGDFTTQIDATDEFTVTGSTGNDGDYTVVGVTANGSDTDIEVANVADATADGNINHSALENAVRTASVDYADGWIEFSWLDANDNPQTLAQLKIRVYQQTDNGTAS
jgi:hypothetical protein